MEDCGIDVEGEDASGEPDFPHDLLATLDDKITSPRWVVPVLPEQELETLMQAAIDLSKKGILMECLIPVQPLIYYYNFRACVTIILYLQDWTLVVKHVSVFFEKALPYHLPRF